MRFPLLLPDLRELLQAGEGDSLRDFFEEHHPVDLAGMIEELEPAEGEKILGLLTPRARAETISYLPGDRQVELVEAMPPEDAAALLHLMPHDDRADLVNRLDEEKAEQILRRLAQAEREDIRRLASYEPGTAGSVMTTDYATLPPHLTVREALDRLRHEAPDRETIDYSYVIDHRRKLLGRVSLKRLILSRPYAKIEEIMQRDPAVARVDDDQENVARQIAQYDLIAIPVVDSSDTLVGIVTHDDALDILRQEQTEDLLAFGGVTMPAESESDESRYWQGSIWSSVQGRLKWLLLLFLSGTLTSGVLGGFRWVQDLIPELVAFVPLLIGTGGNAGSQSVGTIIRGLALGEISDGDLFRVLGREALTGLLLGALLGGIGFLFAWLPGQLAPWLPTWAANMFPKHSLAFSSVIMLSILGICLWANCSGALVPLTARKLGIDPALVSAPAISTLVDVTGLVIYYGIAILILVRLH